MKRGGPLRRGKPLRSRSKPRQVSSRRASRIEAWWHHDVRARIVARDRDCVAPRRGHPDPCQKGQRQVHHIKFKSRGGGDEEENLCLLCPWHHDWVHANSKEAERFDLARPSWWQPNQQVEAHGGDEEPAGAMMDAPHSQGGQSHETDH